MTKITIVQGDITQQSVDAIVNAANRHMRGGGGVDGAIHRAGGPDILADCIARFPHGLATGDAGWTTAGRLPAKWVIHTVGPNYLAGETDFDLLVSCYRRSIEIADELGARTVAFPLVGAGVYGWPMRAALAAAFETIWATESSVEEARMVAFDKETYESFEFMLARFTPRRILQGVHELHRRGYQQVRIYPGMSPSGMYWRVLVFDAHDCPDETRSHSLSDGRLLSYSTGGKTEFLDAVVDHESTPGEVADLILSRMTWLDAPVADPAYASWYDRLMALVNEQDAEPVAYSDSYVQPPGWEIGWGGSVHIEPPPAPGWE